MKDSPNLLKSFKHRLKLLLGLSVPKGDSAKDTDTWADDTLSYPSMSLTMPVPISYDDDDEDKTEKDEATLTDSRVIKLDSGKVALISHLEMETSYHPLDQVQPPSNMASILSLSGSTSMHDRVRHSYYRSDRKLA